MGNLLVMELVALSNARSVNNQILTFRAVKEYCEPSIERITFLTMDKEHIVIVRENLKLRYELGDTVLGTRSCHHFVPTSQYTIEGKQLSIDTTVFITHSFLDMPAPQNETLESLKCNDYITCCFDGFWWLALIEMVNKEEKDLTCNFLHPHGPTSQFHWPHGDDRRYVPLNKVITKTHSNSCYY